MKHHLKKLFAPLAVLLALAVAFSVSFWVVGLITPEPLCEEALLRHYFAEELGLYGEAADPLIDVVLPHNIAGMHQLYDAIYDALDDEELNVYLLQWVEQTYAFDLTGNETREEFAQLFFDFTVDVFLMDEPELISVLSVWLASPDPG